MLAPKARRGYKLESKKGSSATEYIPNKQTTLQTTTMATSSTPPLNLATGSCFEALSKETKEDGNEVRT